MKIKSRDLKYRLIFVMFLIALVSSILLSFTSAPDEFCSIGEFEGGCDIVHASDYNYTFGIQNSYYGVVIFLFLSVVAFLQMLKHNEVRKEIIHLSVILGSVVALYFLYIQHFVLGAYCPYCVVTDLSVLIALGVTLAWWNE